MAFCALDSVPDGDVMMADAEKSLQQAPFSALFSGAVMSSDGRQVANTGPEDGGEQQIAAKAREHFCIGLVRLVDGSETGNRNMCWGVRSGELSK